MSWRGAKLTQPPQGAPLEKTFAREEIMLPVKCNQHPWMKMYVNVTKSPFYAISGPDGKYEIKGLPPGEYLAVGVDYMQEGMWNDPDFLESLRKSAQRLALSDGESRSISLRLISP